jgi:hypothetical protein
VPSVVQRSSTVFTPPPSNTLRRSGLPFACVKTADHIPSPHVRANVAQIRLRRQRMRAHEAGDHSLCLPENCAASVVAEKRRTAASESVWCS